MFILNSASKLNIKNILYRSPNARAILSGSPEYPNIKGKVDFYKTKMGVLLSAEVEGLPQGTGTCSSNIFAFHIHEGNSCTGNSEDPFANAMTHYNPDNCPHPAHAGDLPPLFGNNGYAYMSVLTDRFSVTEVIGRTVIIHLSPDDFTTQPSGNSGAKIACGRIMAYRRHM